MIKHDEIIIEPGNPFANCKLNRQEYSDVLTKIVNAYSTGFVLAINNKWGAGKTTFVKMWEQDLKDNEYQTLYFNAWENDFENNPLTALMGEMKTLTQTSKVTAKEFKSVLKKAASLSKHLAPIMVRAIAEKYISTETIKDAIEGVTKGVSDIFESEVKQYSEKKKSVTGFKDSLTKFIEKTNDGKPLVFIIDELDRCRPDYAVSILEQIKHFFSVSNIVFVLSIDKIQLGHAIEGVYGSKEIDSEEYLRRFIDIEYSIPEPDTDTYSKYLYEYFGFDDFFRSETRIKIPVLSDDKYVFMKLCDILFSATSIPLRQQEKIFAHSRLALRAFQDNSYVMPKAFLFLTYLKIINATFYSDLKNKKLSIEDMQNSFLKIVRNKITRETERHLLVLEMELIIWYNNYLYEYWNKPKLYEVDATTSEKKLLIHSKINTDKESEFFHVFENIQRSGNGGERSLEYFFKKIDLLETLKF